MVGFWGENAGPFRWSLLHLMAVKSAIEPTLPAPVRPGSPSGSLFEVMPSSPGLTAGALVPG